MIQHRSISFRGRDLSRVTIAEVAPIAIARAVPDAVAVPGRAGVLLVGGHMAPREIQVRLHLRVGSVASESAVGHAKSAVAAALATPGGGTLVLPDGMEYRDVVVEQAGAWSGSGPDAFLDVTFVAYDPIGLGEKQVGRTSPMLVEGTWPTYPVVRGKGTGETFVAMMTDARGDFGVTVDSAIPAGKDVVADFEAETLTVDGADWSGSIVLASRMRAAEPGQLWFDVRGLRKAYVEFRERWA